MNIKKLKAELKKKTDKHPEKYYPVKVLKERGFKRYKCACGMYFWSIRKASKCGDCTGYTFIGNPVGKKMNLIETWKLFSTTLKKKGYTPINRYPVVARWNPTSDFTIGSISNFQPYVVSGEVAPPANPLTVAQPSLRFQDTDNVGVTGRHMVCHLHLGQFGIWPDKEYDQEAMLESIIYWIEKGAKLPLDEIKFHEEAWGGGGNLGVALEYFCRGLELGNQVYTMYEVRPNGKYVDLKNKSLDMGSGQERYPWLTHGVLNSYELAYPKVCKKLYKITRLNPNNNVYKKFIPHSGALNMDELKESIEKTWRRIAKKAKITMKDVDKIILPLAALYSIADHSRALLFALADGALPSNVGGGYNLRSIYRRAYDFIQKYNWKISIPAVCKWHAEELRGQYPELVKALPEVKEILEVEEAKYQRTKEKSKIFISKLRAEKKKPTENELIAIYDSFGITPALLKKNKIIASAPSDFYAKVAERHEQKEQAAATTKTTKYSLRGIPDTKKLYYEKALTFRARVLKAFGNKVVLDKTAFYPTSGGQLHDAGTLNGVPVVDVIKQDNHIIHILGGKLKGKTAAGRIDKERRTRLKQHHTATHLIAGAARSVLGGHVWQAGSKVTPDYARLDITHYANLTAEQIGKIERAANTAIKKALKVDKKVLPKHRAEKLYGFRLYQGGAIPGSELRILRIKGLGFEDVEACAGTHCDNTREVEQIKIVGTKRIQDGVVRLEYRAGKQAEAAKAGEQDLAVKVLANLRVSAGIIKSISADAVSQLEAAAKVLKTAPQHLPKTVARFVANLEEWDFDTDKYLKELGDALARTKNLPLAMQNLFQTWKKERKAQRKKPEKTL